MPSDLRSSQKGGKRPGVNRRDCTYLPISGLVKKTVSATVGVTKSVENMIALAVRAVSKVDP